MSCWCPMLLLLSIQMLNIAFLVPLSFMKLCCVSEILFLLFLQWFLVVVDHPWTVPCCILPILQQFVVLQRAFFHSCLWYSLRLAPISCQQFHVSSWTFPWNWGWDWVLASSPSHPSFASLHFLLISLSTRLYCTLLFFTSLLCSMRSLISVVIQWEVWVHLSSLGIWDSAAS